MFSSLFRSLMFTLPSTKKLDGESGFMPVTFFDVFSISCSSSISPTISSIISSNVTIPRNSPYSSTTIEKCSFLFLNSIS